MPVLTIMALPQADPSRIEPALKAAAAAIAGAYGCAPEEVWAIWQEIPPGCYLEGDRAAGEQPKTTHPPVGRLLCFEGRDAETIAATLTAAAGSLSSALGIPGNIFIEYAEARSGRVIAGDGVVRR
jgi:hypothetical protein